MCVYVCVCVCVYVFSVPYEGRVIVGRQLELADGVGEFVRRADLPHGVTDVPHLEDDVIVVEGDEVAR